MNKIACYLKEGKKWRDMHLNRSLSLEKKGIVENDSPLMPQNSEMLGCIKSVIIPPLGEKKGKKKRSLLMLDVGVSFINEY